MPADIRSAFVLLNRQHWLGWTLLAVKLDLQPITTVWIVILWFKRGFLMQIIAVAVWAKQRAAKRIDFIFCLDKGCHFLFL
jgi:hypothetical protein